MNGDKGEDYTRGVNFGDLKGRMTNVEKQLDEVKTSQRSMAKDISSIRDTLSQAKGGWKTLLLVAGAGGAMGALLLKLSTITSFLPK